MLKSFGNFDLVRRDVLGFSDITVSRWRSRESGLTVIHLDYEAPIVKGYFTVGTEIFDDTGCPHTLEHLVFMGSQKYPYKGIIDRFANRGFSNGTNAWTSQDHTCYTVSTAGSQGFLQILPIYVDHILYPTLTREAFLTEVHHIDPQGNDSGVVYSEMQGRENSSGDLMTLALQRLVYPEGSAYRTEVGGLMENLRVLSIEQIRNYHGTYYVPQNLALIVGGKFIGGTEELLSVVNEQIEPTIVSHGQNKGSHPPGWKRPFLETPSANRTPFTESRSTEVQFPEKDESMGEIILSFMGPAPDQHLERLALDILGTYLTSSSVSPLNKEYVEVENPLCSYIYFDEEVRPTFVDLPVYVGSVPTENLQGFDSKLKESLRKIASSGIDMDRMAMVISRDQRQLRSKLESSKGDTYSLTVISDFVLGPADGSGLLGAMDDMSLYPILQKWSSEDWSNILRKYYVDPPCIVVRGKPSAALADKLETDEKKRVEKQVEVLGPEGLQKAKEELETAKAKHEEPIPEELIKTFPVPDVHSIAWIPVQSLQEGTSSVTERQKSISTPLKRHIEADGTALPFFVEFDHVQSDFFTIHAFLSLADIPDHLRPLVTVYLSAFFQLPVQCSDGKKLSYEQVVAKLDDDTVSYETELGVQMYFAETFRISIKAETRMYEKTVRWVKDLIYGAEFDIARLQVTCAKIMQSMPELKRDGSNILSSFQCEMIYDKSSTTRANSVLAQAEAVPKLVQRLKDSPEEVQKDFQLLRKCMTNPAGVRFSVTGNILALDKPRSVWSKYFGEKLPSTPLKPITLAGQTLSELGQQPKEKAIVVSLPTIESSFVAHLAKTVQGFQHPEYPALRLALEILNASEGFLWRSIRGSGLAYGASVSCDLEAGLLSFTLYRSSNSIEAFHEGAKVVKGLADRTIPLEDSVVDAGKSAIVYNLTRAVSNPSSAAMGSFINQALKGASQDFHREMLEKYQAVTTEQVLKALEKYVLPVFDPKQSIAISVSAPGKVNATIDGLKAIGFQVESREVYVDPEEINGVDEDGSHSESDSESESDDERARL
ncbi:hypothetical protein SCHPADRAFT_817077 [Schizopora paradoxa]|uniref:Mitochondrial presequence protease n=1 Tax=Schizopora paradoxa TaxID=27342 RepID=A0A0H2S7M8_9AGAM|nr:hypothetical protein SCHPADRAFT_817077 [Schizopora paradoxa]